MTFSAFLDRIRPSVTSPRDYYDEKTFRHFLSVERRRAEQAGRDLFLVLVGVKADSFSGDRIPKHLVGPLFSGLARAVREVDFIGWYDEHVTAGAVLTQRGKASPGVPETVAARLTTALGSSLSANAVERLDIRVTLASRAFRAN